MAKRRANTDEIPREDRRLELSEALAEAAKRTPPDFLRACFQFPDLTKVRIEKFGSASWNYVTTLDVLGAGFDPETIEPWLREKFGAWRYRLRPVHAEGLVLPHCLVQLDGWQDAERDEAQRRPQGPRAEGMASGRSTPVLDSLRERVEVLNATTALESLGGRADAGRMEAQILPVKLMADVMASMTTMMREAMTAKPATVADPSAPVVEMLRLQIAEMREDLRAARAGSAAPAPDALSRMVTTINGLLETALGTNLSEVLTARGAAPDPSSAWASTVRGIVEGLKPFLPDVLASLQTLRAAPPAPAPARVVALRRVGGPEVPTSHIPTPSEEVTMAPTKLPEEIVEVLTMLYDALRSEAWETADALLVNPPLAGMVRVNPKVPGRVYATLLAVYDARFKDAAREIDGYCKWAREQADDDDPDAGGAA